MAQEYVDIVRDIIEDQGLDELYLYEDGDGYNDEILLADSWEDLRELNQALREAFMDMGIEVDDSRYDENDKYDTTYVDFALGDDGWSFYDEAFTCDECGKAYRMDSYGYANYFVSDWGITCADCVRNNPDAYIEELTNNPKKCNTILAPADLESAGFEQLGDTYENGWYGRSDDPEDILDNILADHPDAEVIFDVHQTGNPWATRFDVYVRNYDEYDDDEDFEDDDFEE